MKEGKQCRQNARYALVEYEVTIKKCNFLAHPFRSFIMEPITLDSILSLFRNRPNPQGRAKLILLLVGIILTPITMAGALWGYMRGYNRFIDNRERFPDFTYFPPMILASMVVFAVVIWLIILAVIVVAGTLIKKVIGGNVEAAVGMPIIAFNLVVSAVVLAAFFFWQRRTINAMTETRRHGTARLGGVADVLQYAIGDGLLIGDHLSYRNAGHILTCGATRSGKGTSLIIPALLDKTTYHGSWVIIDPKGENAAITADYQRSKGQNVLLLDPWGICTDNPATYDPMDFVKTDENLADDAMIIAEMIVPNDPKNRDRFWSDRARSIIAGLVMHIKKNDLSLCDLYTLLRLDDVAFARLVGILQTDPDPVIRATGNEIRSGMKSEKTFTSIMSAALQHTDFLKSPMLARSLEKSNFNVSALSEGKTTLYVIIPSDKLQSHYQWLRLVTTTTMRAVIRTHNRRVTFLLDEFANLGPLPDVSEFGMTAAAGYNISLWMIVQSLPQLRNLYGDNWENFIANTAVRQYVGVNDNFTAEYVSASMGQSTYSTSETSGQGFDRKTHYNTTGRAVLTPDEVKTQTATNIILQIDQNPTVLVPKAPYYEDATLQARAQANPMHRAATA